MTEIKDSLLDTYGRKDTVIMLRNLQDEIEDNHAKVSTNISLMIDSICDDDLCPVCASELTVVDTYEEEREFQGTQCFETINEIGCEHCGIIY